MNKLFSSSKKLLLAGLFVVSLSLFMIVQLNNSPDAVAQKWPYDQGDAPEISLSEAWDYVDLKNFDEENRLRVGILDDYVYIWLEDGTVKSKIPYPSTGLIADFVKYSSADLQIYKNTSFKTSTSDRILGLLPAFVILGLLFFMLARGATKSLGLSSSFKVVDVSDIKEVFDDVAGIQNARADIEEIVQFLKNPSKITSLGGRMPKGVLFDGPPGTGKTLLARALAKEAGVPFMSIDASSINQIFVGAGAMKLRSAFKAARKMGNCIIFIDEIDAMGKARGGSDGPGGASDEKETTLNTLLVEMDGFDSGAGVFVIAATNRAETLDPALTRSGRFDRKIEITLPDVKGRSQILEVHLRKIKIDETVSSETLSRTTYGFSGADLALLVNEAAITAALRNASAVSAEDFNSARDKMLLGRNSSDRTLSVEERKITAYHEAGHAYIAHTREHADPIEKATILPGGKALGYVMQSPDTDRLIETKARLHARLDVAVAGRVAETIFGTKDMITTGAQSDIEQATSIARAMTEKWGMSKMGFVSISGDLSPLHQGEFNTSDEVRSIINDAIDRVTKDMTSRKSAVKRIATALLANETLNAEQIDRLVKNRKI